MIFKRGEKIVEMKKIPFYLIILIFIFIQGCIITSPTKKPPENGNIKNTTVKCAYPRCQNKAVIGPYCKYHWKKYHEPK